MIYLNDQDTIEGVTVYGDSQKFDTFYLIPEQPRFRLDEKGRPVFKFLKYRFPVDRPDGKQGGGYVTFDVEFTIPEKKKKKIVAKLQERVDAEVQRRRIPDRPVKIASVPYLKGTSRLNIMNEGGALVERIFNAGKPSLFGKNISTYSIELTPEGATLFEQALQGQGGFVSVIYELYHDAQLPPLRVTGSFRASAFYKFVQEIDIEERVCAEDDYKETLSEVLTRSGSKNVEVHKGSSQVEQKVIDEIRKWALQSVDDAAEQYMLEAIDKANPEEARKWYAEHDIEDVRIEVTKRQVSSFKLEYKEHTVIEKNINPQGIMPNITTLKDKEGKKILWEDYAVEIDLNDPFFQQLRVAVMVNAPFDDLPLHSIEVKLSYDGEPMAVLDNPIDGEFRFTNPDDIAKFSAFIKKDKNKYNYSYQVNYLGSRKSFQSEIFEVDSAEGQLTINVDDVGILLVDVSPGDIDFKDVEQVHLVMQYEDQRGGVDLIERQFIIDKNNPNHRLEEVIFSKRAQPYRYKCKYFMTNGKEYLVDWQDGESNRLYINDPFVGDKTVRIMAIGDLEEQIATIFADFNYKEASNNYEQSTSVVLNNRQQFFDWEFPVVDSNSGVVTYSGNIVYRDGTVKDIPSSVAKSNTVMVGEKRPKILTIEVLAFLIDFVSSVRMARIQLKYNDATNGVHERKDLIFAGNREMQQSWSIKLADETLTEFEWTATYFMADGTRTTVGPQKSEELSIVLDVPVPVTD